MGVCRSVMFGSAFVSISILHNCTMSSTDDRQIIFGANGKWTWTSTPSYNVLGDDAADADGGDAADLCMDLHGVEAADADGGDAISSADGGNEADVCMDPYGGADGDSMLGLIHKCNSEMKTTMRKLKVLKLEKEKISSERDVLLKCAQAWQKKATQLQQEKREALIKIEELQKEKRMSKWMRLSRPPKPQPRPPSQPPSAELLKKVGPAEQSPPPIRRRDHLRLKMDKVQKVRRKPIGMA